MDDTVVQLADHRAQVLEVLPRTLLFPFVGPRRDEAYHQVMASSGGGEMMTLPPPAGSPCFLQFDLWEGRGDNWRDLRSGIFPLCLSRKHVQRPVANQTPPNRFVAIELADNVGLLVWATRPAGQLISSTVERYHTDKWFKLPLDTLP